MGYEGMLLRPLRLLRLQGEGRGNGGCEERPLLMHANRPTKGALLMHDLLMHEKRPTNAYIAAH